METQNIQNTLQILIPDAVNFNNHYGNWISFESKGSDRRTKKCVCKYDNNGIKTILKQIDVFKPMKYMINGQPTSNCKTIFSK